MSSIQYDIVIRTTGKGGDNYQLLLTSIRNLTPQPQNIFIILPEGYPPPSEHLGCEQFVYAQKGMMTQRLAAYQYCQSEYVLFCDDDLQFSPDFVTKLYRGVTTDGFSIATGEVLAFLPKKHKSWICAISLTAVPALFNKKNFVTILKSSGWVFHRFTPQEGISLPTQSAAGISFFTKLTDFKKIHFEDELWAQHGALAPMDDQIMFYKAHILGLGVCVVTDAHYKHLDSKNATSSPLSKNEKIFWASFNRVIFWNRFIYEQETSLFGKLCACIAFAHSRICSALLLLIKDMLNFKCDRFKLLIKGQLAGMRFVRSKEYTQIKPVKN